MLGDGLDKPISPQMAWIGWSHNPEVGTKTQRRELQNASEHEIAERPEQDRLLRDGGTGARL
jgi:hypothetical protein